MISEDSTVKLDWSVFRDEEVADFFFEYNIPFLYGPFDERWIAE